MSDNNESGLAVVPRAEMAETASSAQAAQAQASVLAQYRIAELHPRNMLDVRSGLLKECERPGFAERARYGIPFKRWNPETRQQETEFVRGFSIRFAEAVARMLGNIIVRTPTVYDDDDKRIVQVSVVDLENNTAYSKDCAVEKTTERKKLRKGQRPLRQRENSYGDTVYLVRATEQDVEKKAGAEVSKAIRTCLLRLVPGDILEECEDRVKATLEKQDKADPDAATKRVVDGYAKLGIKASELEELLGHGLESVHESELEKLRGYFEALREGAATWPQILELEHGEAPDKGEEDPMAETRKKVREALHKSKTKAERSKKRRENAKKKKADAAPADPPASAAGQEEPPADPPADPPDDEPPAHVDLPTTNEPPMREPGEEG